MRIGVLSDVHCELEPPCRRRWINTYEPERVGARIAAALARFRDAAVDLVVLLGDISEKGDPGEFEAVFQAVAAAGFAQAAVPGNHDVGPGSEEFEAATARFDVSVIANGGLSLPGSEIVGIGIRPAPTAARLFLATPTSSPGARVSVVASHFPVLSEAARLASAGLPYPGDLLDRAELERQLAASGMPLVVLSGHIHARCSSAAGPILQLSAGALIEPPFDCAVVDIAPGRHPRVERRSYRQGPPSMPDPVYAPDVERWTWLDGGWLLLQ